MPVTATDYDSHVVQVGKVSVVVNVKHDMFKIVLFANVKNLTTGERFQDFQMARYTRHIA